MRHAYLIMAHDQPGQLARLVSAIHCDWTKIYIHIDSKSDLRPFENAIGSRSGVHFLTHRVKANWMGFSLVDAMLKLLVKADSDGFDYCTLLSGADYPIKSNGYLRSFFESAQKEYIAFWRLEDRPDWLRKVQYYYFTDHVPIRAWIENKEPGYWRRLFWGRYFKYQKYMPKRKMPLGLQPFGGPDWWSLSGECVRDILKYIEENPGLIRFFRYTSSPGELFFQTLILNSAWCDKVENYSNYIEWSNNRSKSSNPGSCKMLADESFNYRYVDWSGEISGEREMPAILDMRDFKKIMATNALFARKVHPLRSAELLDTIDREIRKDDKPYVS